MSDVFECLGLVMYYFYRNENKRNTNFSCKQSKLEVKVKIVDIIERKKSLNAHKCSSEKNRRQPPNLQKITDNCPSPCTVVSFYKTANKALMLKLLRSAHFKALHVDEMLMKLTPDFILILNFPVSVFAVPLEVGPDDGPIRHSFARDPSSIRSNKFNQSEQFNRSHQSVICICQSGRLHVRNFHPSCLDLLKILVNRGFSAFASSSLRFRFQSFT